MPAEIAHPAPPLVVMMGVSGSGKTTVGAALAQRLRVPFADADDFHPEANIAKMSAGIPLDDDGPRALARRHRRLAGRAQLPPEGWPAAPRSSAPTATC